MRNTARRLLDPRVILLALCALLLIATPAMAQDPVPLLQQEDVVMVRGATESTADLARLRQSVERMRDEGYQVKYLVLGVSEPDLSAYMKQIRSDTEFEGVLAVITPTAVGATASVDDDQIVATLRAERGEAKDATEMAINSAERLAGQQEGSQRSLLRIIIIGLMCVLPLWLIWYIRSTPRFGDDPDAVNVDASPRRRTPGDT